MNVNQESRSGIAYLHIRSSIPDSLPPARVGNAALSMGAEELTQVRVWMANEFGRRTHDAAWAVYFVDSTWATRFPTSVYTKMLGSGSMRIRSKARLSSAAFRQFPSRVWFMRVSMNVTFLSILQRRASTRGQKPRASIVPDRYSAPGSYPVPG